VGPEGEYIVEPLLWFVKGKHDGVWRDDGQVARLDVTKTYGEKPGCMVEIRTLEGTA